MISIAPVRAPCADYGPPATVLTRLAVTVPVRDCDCAGSGLLVPVPAPLAATARSVTAPAPRVWPRCAGSCAGSGPSRRDSAGP